MKDVFAKNENGSACSMVEELVAYLYGELPAEESLNVEKHLSSCDACTSEFADLSFARLDVFEWNRDEFAGMETPRITVPYDQPAVSPSWLAVVRTFFSSPMRWTVPAAGFAVVAIAFGSWIGSAGPVEVAGTNSNIVSSPIPSAPPAPDNPREEIAASTTDEKKPVKRPSEPASAKARPVKALAHPVPRPSAAATAERAPKVKTALKTKAAPRLNDFDDDDDTTLRLGDLLAEVDTRD